ncbi:MAG TPA: hypothetical protein EYG33_05885, partial [Candidatus Poseidoniales archaeon]|nr:hypothetical protein [Candidatus Poseidoniales archaeon]
DGGRDDRRGRDGGRDDRRGRDGGRDDRRGRDGGRDNRNSNQHGDNDWECPKCSNSNFSFRTECNMCGQPKRERAARSQSNDWQGEDRRMGDRRGEVEKRAGDWDCPDCGKSNFAKRNDCFSCGRSKRVGGPKPKGHHRKSRDPSPLQSADYGRGRGGRNR